ncbi:MAG: DUF3772 domain-containing protein [Marinibacterium sp.]
MTRALAAIRILVWAVLACPVGPVLAQDTARNTPPAEQAQPAPDTPVAEQGQTAPDDQSSAGGTADAGQGLGDSLINDLAVLSDQSIDLAAWEKLVNRAELVIDRNQASTDALEDLRAELVNYRSRFADIRDKNASRIRSLRSQIDRLGPVPDSGDEPRSVALTRQALNDRLDQISAPVAAAEAAFGITDGLVSEIDALLRARRAEEFIKRGPSPLLPENWAIAGTEVTRFVRSLNGEIAEALTNDVTLQAARDKAPRLVIMVLAGLYLLIRGPILARKFGTFMRGFGGQGSGVWTFLVSLGRFGLPYAGVVLIVNALKLSGIPGLRLDALLGSVPVWAATLLSVFWLRNRLFSPEAAEEGHALAPERRLPEISFLLPILAILEASAHAVSVIVQSENMQAETEAVLQFPLSVLTSLLLFRLATVLFPEPRVPVDDDAPDTGDAAGAAGGRGYGPILPGLCWISRLVAVAVPVLAALGFTAASIGTLYPMIWTLALFGAVVAVHDFVARFYGWAMGGAGAPGDSLVPALAGVLLVLAAVPGVALIWGIRPTELQEIWTRFLEGVQIGGTRVSPIDLLTFLVIFSIGYVATRLLQGALRTNLLPKTRIDPGGQTAIVSGTGYVGIFLAALVAISSTGLDLSSLAIVAGALSVGIGFGLQTIVSNFVSGIILLIERPVSEGDWIEVGSHMGIVKDISVRATRIETFDRMDVVVPNSDLISGTVTNYTRTPIGRVIVPVGVAYGTDTRKVEGILREIGEAHPMAVARPAPFVLFKGFGADSLDFELRVVIRDINWGLTVRTDINHAIAERFAAEGIEIPFAQRDLWLRNPETLADLVAAPPKKND